MRGSTSKWGTTVNSVVGCMYVDDEQSGCWCFWKTCRGSMKACWWFAGLWSALKHDPGRCGGDGDYGGDRWGDVWRTVQGKIMCFCLRKHRQTWLQFLPELVCDCLISSVCVSQPRGTSPCCLSEETAWSLWLHPSVWVNLVGLSLILWGYRCKPCRSVFRPLLEFLLVVKITLNIILSFLGIVVCISAVDEVSSSWFYKNWLWACFSSLEVRLFPLTAQRSRYLILNVLNKTLFLSVAVAPNTAGINICIFLEAFRFVKGG